MGGKSPPAKNRGVWGAAPPSQIFEKTTNHMFFCFQGNFFRVTFLSVWFQLANLLPNFSLWRYYEFPFSLVNFTIKWSFLFCFVPKTVYRANFFKLFAKVFRIFRPRGNFFDGQNFFQILAGSAAIRLDQKSSKSGPSSSFFGCLKFRESLSRTSSFKIFYADTK